MKHVIVRIRDCRPTYARTRARFYYYSVAQYKSKVIHDVSSLMPGEEIWVKVGNLYSKFISYEDIINILVHVGIFEAEEVYNKLIEDIELNYWINQYLPEY